LSEENSREANRLAAENLKQRYIRDQKTLLDTIEAERERQRARLMKAMAKKRGKMSDEEIENSHDQLKEQLESLERSLTLYSNPKFIPYTLTLTLHPNPIP